VPLLLNTLKPVMVDDAPVDSECFQCLPAITDDIEPGDGEVVSMAAEIPGGVASVTGPLGSGTFETLVPGKESKQPDEGDEGAQADDEEFEDEEEAETQGRDLKKEAQSLAHQLTHAHRNPHCDVCKEAVMNNKAKRRGAAIEKRSRLTAFGDNVCADHSITRHDGWDKGYDGSTVGLVIHDLFSSYTDLYGKKTKGWEDCYEAMHDFVADHWVKTFYSDRSKEFLKACKWLGWNHAKSQTNMPRTNPVAERQVQRVTRGVRKILSQAGLPNKFWPLAARCCGF
jgi:hypothetical protein